MDSVIGYLILGAISLAVLLGGTAALIAVRARGRGALPPAPVTPTIDVGPGETSTVSEDVATSDADAGDVDVDVDVQVAGRMQRLRARLARSNTAIGQGLLSLLSRDGGLDAAEWDEVEAVLLQADLGPGPTAELMDSLRRNVRVGGVTGRNDIRVLLRDQLLQLVDPALDRTVVTTASGRPAVILVVGVNGTGKTTTTGKLAKLLVDDGRTVVLAAADTFRAAATAQLVTWGERAGASVVTGADGADPASVAFAAVSQAIDTGADVVVIDTAGRLHTKAGLMDELGKVKRVVEKLSAVDEVLLVLDATTGQNGLRQAEVFGAAVDVTGIALTKLDGTAKGGIVVAVQRDLGVPVKLVGLGEGMDDLAPFEADVFVDALVE